jgi:hypothetical protein
MPATCFFCPKKKNNNDANPNCKWFKPYNFELQEFQTWILGSCSASSSSSRDHEEITEGKPPEGGGRQQPHHSLKKFKKYKGGKKCHTMVAQSSPKMPK